MKRTFFVVALGIAAMITHAQHTVNLDNSYANAADNLLVQNSKLLIGGYGEVHYNQALDGQVRNNGKLDVHRMVMLFGYNFSSKTRFVTEIEFEHVSEVYIEQAFLQYQLNNTVNFRGGLLLVPMGIINEYHEPTTFNGVERPLTDTYLAPSTWREIGFGVTGNILPLSLKYQAYVLNGFDGYDGSGKLNGANGFRKGRQKGAESYISSPNLSAKVEYYGIRGLNIGLAGYFGNTQSTIYNGISKSDDAALAVADSSVVGIAMLGLDARYTLKGLQLRGQFYYTGISNSNQYNAFTADATPNNLGSSMLGYYVEAGYNVLRTVNTDKQLIPFVRYAFLNTHNTVEKPLVQNPAFEKTAITTGLTLNLSRGTVVKADVQLLKDAASDTYATTFNAGIGVMF